MLKYVKVPSGHWVPSHNLKALGTGLFTCGIELEFLICMNPLSNSWFVLVGSERLVLF